MKIIISTVLLFTILQVFLTYNNHSDRSKVFIGPSKSIKNFTFGYDDFIASLMWVRLVQDFHVCDQNKEQVKYPSFHESEDPLGEVLNRQLPQSRCDEGWVYQMLDVISELQPRFKSVYLDGGTMLSVLVDDRQGAEKILQKGIVVYPDDWELLYRAAYHELFEMQNGEKAQSLLLRAAQRGAPEWVYSLAAKLMTRNGQGAFALSILESVLQRDQGGQYTERIKSQMQNIKKAMGEPQKDGTQPQNNQ